MKIKLHTTWTEMELKHYCLSGEGGKRQILKKSLELIIQDAALWLLSKEGDYGFGRFPNKVIDSISKGQNRIAWCYGDLAVGIAMLNASEVCKECWSKTKLMKLSQRVFRKEVDRSAVFHFLDEGYVDAGFLSWLSWQCIHFWKLWKTYSDDNFMKLISIGLI